MNNTETMTIKISENIAQKLSNMAQESHNSLNEILLKSIYLMEIAIKNKQNGNRLAIIDPDLKPEDGDIVLAKMKDENEIVFRQYQVEGKKITLEAFNSDKIRFPSLPLDQIEKIIGVVIFHGSFNKKKLEFA